MNIPAPLANAIVVLVSLVWAGNFTASVFIPGYSSDSTLNFVFMTVVGGALALRGGESGGVGSWLSRVMKPPPPPAEPANPPQERP